MSRRACYVGPCLLPFPQVQSASHKSGCFGSNGGVHELRFDRSVCRHRYSPVEQPGLAFSERLGGPPSQSPQNLLKSLKSPQSPQISPIFSNLFKNTKQISLTRSLPAFSSSGFPHIRQLREDRLSNIIIKAVKVRAEPSPLRRSPGR